MKNDRSSPVIFELMWHLNSKSQEVFVKMVSELGFALRMGILISLCVLSPLSWASGRHH